MSIPAQNTTYYVNFFGDTNISYVKDKSTLSDKTEVSVGMHATAGEVKKFVAEKLGLEPNHCTLKIGGTERTYTGKDIAKNWELKGSYAAGNYSFDLEDGESMAKAMSLNRFLQYGKQLTTYDAGIALKVLTKDEWAILTYGRPVLSISHQKCSDQKHCQRFVNISTFSGNTTIPLPEGVTLEQLQELIAKETNIPASEQKLFGKRNQEMKDESSFADIIDGSTIGVVHKFAAPSPETNAGCKNDGS